MSDSPDAYKEGDVTKFLNKWLRKIHRWIAMPFVVTILVLIFTRQMPAGAVAQRVQMVLVLFMAVTGTYLFLLPYLTRWQRRARTHNVDD